MEENERLSQEKQEESIEIKDTIEGFYSTAAYARLYGVRPSTVEQCIRDGRIVATPVKVGRKVGYEISEHTTSYIKDLREKAAGRTESGSLESLKKQKLKADIALKEAQGELHEIKNGLAKGEFLKREDVKNELGSFMLNFKKFALSIPSRVAGHMIGHLEPLEVRAIEDDLMNEVTKVLNEFVMAGVTDEEPVIVGFSKVGRPKKRS